MSETHHFIKVEFSRFKAFKSFTLHLKHFNILVGPNNAGKSTILAAFRILDSAMKKAATRKAESVPGPEGRVPGYAIDLSAISVAEENIFFNYDDSDPAVITFTLSNKNELTLYFPEQGSCYLIVEAQGKSVLNPSAFKKNFNCPIGFVPILGPVEHIEPLFEKEAARQALSNYRAARNFRNIWYHYPDRFDEFRAALVQSWPGMDIEPPRPDYSYTKARLHMFCPEERIPREIFWAGFGFQVWCQMLTHIIQSHGASIFLVDEPDIYLHSDLQRQLLGILRNLGPDILIATHSTEIITEAEAEEIVVINKKKTKARRIKDPSQLEEVFSVLGSNLNPVLTQLAKTRRVLFLEGKDFQIIGKFASKLKIANVSSRRDFAVVPIEGFNPEKIRILKIGMQETLGVEVSSAAVLDRDYRCESEILSVAEKCSEFCEFVKIHQCKEIENYLLVPAAIDRSIERKIVDHSKRTGIIVTYEGSAAAVLEKFASDKKAYVSSQCISSRKLFERSVGRSHHEATLNELVLREIDAQWECENERIKMIPGKEALKYLNQTIQERYSVSLTASSIIEAMKIEEVPSGMKELVKMISDFASIKK